MASFEEAYKALNAAQREAVDIIDGPLLVIAGPGTGKTQLLSARVTNILTKTDTPARAILCLTFTENGAENMRERLSRFIGPAAYDVTISTYHAFGREIIQRFPEYFTETRLQNPIDELGQRQIIAELVEAMRYSNPLKQTRHHEGDLISTLSEVKRALLSSEDLRLLAAENVSYIRHANHDIRVLLADFRRMPALAEARRLFTELLTILAKHAPEQPVQARFGSLAQTAITALTVALETSDEAGKTTPLTEWKNDWLVRDADNELVFDGELASKRIEALADVLDQYQAVLATRGLYDFDDMIARAIMALETHDDLRATLQERYLYILLDEFQDTNAAQLRLVELLTNSPVHEGRPNVMAVGDDDQAIYAFQGAQYSNMLDFYHLYHDVRVINLTENYRSHRDIVSVADNISDQIIDRLHGRFDGVSKELVAVRTDLGSRADITRNEFLSDIAQADWIAHDIQAKIVSEVAPHDIAVLAPKHRQLEPLVPYLNALKIPVHYEKRENILDAPVVKQLITMARLVLALQAGDDATADSLWPEVLSYDFWQLPTTSIWQISWQVTNNQRQAIKGASLPTTWSQVLVADDKRFRIPALLFLNLALRVGHETGEAMIDFLTGSTAIDTNETDLPHVYSPLREYFTSDVLRKTQPELFYETLSHMTVLRARLRARQGTSEAALSLQDIVDFTDMYHAADEPMNNSSPYNQDTDAVQLMTIYKAKGLEFDHVYLPGLVDEVWGSSSRVQANRITLPANLAPIRHAGATEDEHLRVFYVAATRAKVGLHLASVTQNYSGRATKRLKYLHEEEQADGSFKDAILPEFAQNVERNDSLPPSIDLLELDWRKRHLAATHKANLRALLQPRLDTYRVSPTHLTTFLDIEFAGPQRFFLSTLLHFPEAPTPDTQFGNAIHETLDWVQQRVTVDDAVPDTTEALAYFTRRMQAKKLAEARTALEIERGETALAAYLVARRGQFKPGDPSEISFRPDNIMLNGIPLTGKIDRLELNNKQKTITIVDYKTGKGYSRWLMDPRLYRYQRQLYFYKLLVEHSIRFRGWTVAGGRLEFVEPDSSGQISSLDLAFEPTELKRTEALIHALWQHVTRLDFPSIAMYDTSVAGIKRLEQDLIDGHL